MPLPQRTIFNIEIDGRQVEIIYDLERALEVLADIANSGKVHALDFETTTLWPKQGGRVRITSLSGPCGNFIIDHDGEPDLAFGCIFAQIIRGGTWAVFNAGFEQRWMDHYMPRQCALLDVGLMSKARLGGRPLSLKQMVQRDLEKERNKELQNSDWSAKSLTAAQYEYAGEDAIDTYDLLVMWAAIIAEHDCEQQFYILNDAVRGTTVMEDNGLLVDPPYHQTLIDLWTRRRDVAEKAIRRITDAETLPNIRSKPQLSKLISSVLDKEALAAWPKTEKHQQLDTSRKVLAQASFRAPYPFSRWLAALMVFNKADKYLSTYGEKFLNIQALQGRVRTRFNIAQAVTRRYSSSEPNLQNIPRAPYVRRSFIASPNAVMLLADYSGIELRVLGELSGDEQLLRDVIYGDMHAENAVIQNGLDRDQFFAALKAKNPKAKSMRSGSKAFSFQLTYGAGIPALALALRTTDDAARHHVDAWAARYPKAYNYRFGVYEKMKIDGFIRSAGGGSIYVHRNDRSLPVASNYPIQASAGDVMYCAITRTEEEFNFYNQTSTNKTHLLASIHDELLAEIRFRTTREQNKREEKAREMLDVMKRAMVSGWLDVFPGTDTNNLLEAEIGYSWAAKP